jgi:hypothetical protein
MEVSFIHLQQSNLGHKSRFLIVNQNFQEPKTSYVLTTLYALVWKTKWYIYIVLFL